jgi:hypothetical protein
MLSIAELKKEPYGTYKISGQKGPLKPNQATI